MVKKLKRADLSGILDLVSICLLRFSAECSWPTNFKGRVFTEIKATATAATGTCRWIFHHSQSSQLRPRDDTNAADHRCISRFNLLGPVRCVLRGRDQVVSQSLMTTIKMIMLQVAQHSFAQRLLAK